MKNPNSFTPISTCKFMEKFFFDALELKSVQLTSDIYFSNVNYADGNY